MVLVAINQTISGALFGLKRLYVPALAITVGCIIKFILNIILIRNPNINIYGAAISSLVSQLITFIISYTVTKKEIKLHMNFKNNILKPILAGVLMAGVLFGIQSIFGGHINNIILTVGNVCVGGVVYIVAIVLLKVLSKEEFMLLPMGDKMYNVLKKLKIYE